jgi:hypothetical protein
MAIYHIEQIGLYKGKNNSMTMAKNYRDEISVDFSRRGIVNWTENLMVVPRQTAGKQIVSKTKKGKNCLVF